MTLEQFEEIAENILDDLPGLFNDKIDNVQIVVEDYPTEDIIQKMHVTKTSLLGLYQGIPLKHRGPWYGSTPTIPDKITLYQKNIEAGCRSDNELHERIRDVLLHEIGHFFGMSEEEIRTAMKKYNHK